jgi:hypothetical protein
MPCTGMVSKFLDTLPVKVRDLCQGPLDLVSVWPIKDGKNDALPVPPRLKTLVPSSICLWGSMSWNPS